MANAVCSSGNRKVPASLIKALFDVKRQSQISEEQLNIALEELVKARFGNDIPEDGMMSYLNIVGKTAVGPDERVSALKPLAQALVAQRKVDQLDQGIGAASQYWPSWRKVDSEFLKGRGNQPEAHATLTAEDARTWADRLVKQPNPHPTFLEESLRGLAEECGDDHLRTLIGQLDADYQARNGNRITELFAASRYKRVLNSVLQVLLKERDSIDQCVVPYQKLLSTAPKKSPLHKIGMDTLNETLKKSGSRVKTMSTPSDIAPRPTTSFQEQPVQWHEARGLDKALDYF